MYYTIIHKSGHETDMWQVGKTFTNKKDAENYKANEKSHDGSCSFFFIRIKAHRLHLGKLFSSDNNTVKFSDGTIAMTR